MDGWEQTKEEEEREMKCVGDIYEDDLSSITQSQISLQDVH